MVRRFLNSQGGGVAMMFALSVVPLALGVGAAIDYSRATLAHAALQSRVDEAALAAASTGLDQSGRIEELAGRILSQNPPPFSVASRITKAEFDTTREEVRIEAVAALPTTFMRLVGISTIDVGADASARPSNSGNVEIALVLDNTYSMSERDSTGRTKIESLKSSATDLVNQIKPNARSSVKFALVPYADYVNVGVQNRSKTWVRVAADYTVTGGQQCSTTSSETTCSATGAPQTCTRYRDGVAESYDCTARTCTTTPVPPRESCWTNPDRKYRWFGCVGSRVTADLRLDDSEPSSPYPGLLNTWQTCPGEIVALTGEKSRITSAIQGMAVNSSTYIPAGLVWGLNVLSPSEPFSEGLSYDARNPATRKIMVLMTDGENTMALNKTDGTHYGAEGGSSQLALTNQDTARLCENIKTKKIEIYSVAFAVKSTSAKSLLQGCATSASHYFDAENGTALASAFDRIAKSISGVVRLSR